jgi:hypothetical protein
MIVTSTSVTCHSSTLEVFCNLIESTAYQEQMKRHAAGDNWLDSVCYKRILKRTERMAFPPDLGSKILQFIYF